MTTSQTPSPAPSLLAAAKALFSLNNYDIMPVPAKLSPAYDFMAKSRGDPFAEALCVRTVTGTIDAQLVDALAAASSSGRRLIIAVDRASAPVAERAQAQHIEMLTYTELYRRFEQFEPYISRVLDDGEVAAQLKALNSVYEEPVFEDKAGTTKATSYLKEWRDNSAKGTGRWLIVTGEYGTGKTALTRICQYRWCAEHRLSPAKPIPLRIELRDFARQFDARGLLHHFLDNNALGHLSIDFVLSLIRSGRVLLLLDGYDEMAQYLNPRERRACLEALAEISADGAKGILTSRPNYFSEAEELQVLEVLYRSFDVSRTQTKTAQAIVAREREVDQLLETHFLDRFERSLRDLTPSQTEALVERSLSNAEDRAVVLGLLRRIYRDTDEGAPVSLAGKPVIITFLLEVAEGLKERGAGGAPSEQHMSEWEIFRLIIEQLMWRDYKAAPDLSPERRWQFLRVLAAYLSKRSSPTIEEEEFKVLVRAEFDRELRVYFGTAREEEVDRYFATLRRSATLTRPAGGKTSQWRFSHNSLREFLASEFALEQLTRGHVPADEFAVSDAMKTFVASRTETETRESQRALCSAWVERLGHRGAGSLFCLLWEALLRLHADDANAPRTVMTQISGEGLAFNRCILRSWRAPDADLHGANFSQTEIHDADLSRADLTGSDFSGCLLSGVALGGATLSGATFRDCVLLEVDVAAAVVKDATFRGVDADSSILIEGPAGPRADRVRLVGNRALGYLRYHGADTDPVPLYEVICNNPLFEIVLQRALRLTEQAVRQRRGLEQRGAAHQDVDFARDFVRLLERLDFLRTEGRRDLVRATEAGRTALARLVERREVVPELEEFFRERLLPT